MAKKEKEQHTKDMKHYKKYLLCFLIVIFIALVSYLAFNIYICIRDKNTMKDLQEEIIDTDITNTEEKEDKNQEIIEKVKELQVENEDVKGWIKIEDTNINYPLLQGEDNDYYLDRNFKKEKSYYGSIYIDKDSNLENVNSNIIIYGHNKKDSEMFQNLLNYEQEEYYKSHPDIEIITNQETIKYEIVSVFKSRVFYQNETGVFRYYYCTDLSTEEKYNDYIENCKKIELYDTGIKAEFGEQLITLVTCEYSQDNGRMVVIAKRI